MKQAVAALAAASTLLGAAAAEGPAVGRDSALPVPRFVSLAAESANGRNGPGVEHRVGWIYNRVGLPLQVTGESGPWRRVRDPDGAEVWIHAQNLAPRRTVFVTRSTALRRGARENARPLAYLAEGVIGAITACDGDWRRVAVGGRVGWVEATALWGAEDCTGL